MVVIICIISTLPWIGFSDFATKGEPREASVAISMIESGNWILPQVYANEFAFKPPMAHWLMAIASYPQGYISEFSARLPSVIAFIIMIGFVLIFFGKRFRFQEAFIATLMLITSLEMHRAAMTTRVDMILTAFIVLALIQLFRWEEKLELKGLPIMIPLLLSGAILTKGPVGVVLPLFVFATYLLVLQKYSFLKIARTLLYAFISSLFLPSLWYIAAWKQGGNDFLNVMLAENFGRFFSLDAPKINYVLGHDNNLLYNFRTLITGFVPWTLFFIFSLVGLKVTLPKQSIRTTLCEVWKRVQRMNKPHLFSLVAIFCILFFYSIPSSKRSVYILPAYPFIALFLAQYAIYITEYRTKVTRLFAAFIVSATSVAFIGLILVSIQLISIKSLVANFTNNSSTLMQIGLVDEVFATPTVKTVCIILFLLFTLLVAFYQMSKKNNIKILYASIALTFAVHLIIDGVIIPALRKDTSSKLFVERLKSEHNIMEQRAYVMNDLMNYRNMYGLNFYLGNNFRNFETEQPKDGLLFVVACDLPTLRQNYPTYTFDILDESGYIIREVRDKILLTRISKK
jgi:4-amino-4-deoxy-L-arabinose transferase-like glycosyltransferase